MSWIKVSDNKPDFGISVFVILEWTSGKRLFAVLTRVKEDDCEWRTVDDGSEISYSLTVIKWMLPPKED